MNPSVAYDTRDIEVLRELDRQEKYTVDAWRLKTTYEKVTDVKRRSTLRRRIRSLTASDDFERVGFQRWRWNGRIPDE